MGLEFTDDDIRRLVKELGSNLSVTIRGIDLHSLLARLSAAEECIPLLRMNHAANHQLCENDWCPEYEARKKWRDAAGKSQ